MRQQPASVSLNTTNNLAYERGADNRHLFSKLTDSNQINWFEVSGLTNADAITRIVKDFGLHNLDAKDILTPQHVVKVEEYKGRMLIVLNSCYYDVNNEMRSEHISILVANNTVITFTESNNPVFEAAHKALLSNMLNIRKKAVDCCSLSF